MGICGMALTLGSVEIFRWNKYEVAEIDLPYDDENTILLLHGEEIADSSKDSKTLTNTSVAVSSAQSKFGGKSLYFNGSARVTFPAIDFGSGNFTIDWWEYVTSSSSKSRFSSAYTTGNVCGGILFGYNSTLVYASSALNSVWDLIGGTTGLSNTLNTWVHWAFVREGTTLTSYRNGVKFASMTLSGAIAYNAAYPASVGDYRAGDPAPFIGYIDEFRISNVARWCANFTPPASPYSVSGVGKGDLVGEVKSLNSNAYPDGGVQDGYYYERVV